MKTLHLYLTRQILGTLVLAVAVFTFVLLLGNVLREVFALLFNERASLALAAKAIGLLIPFVLIFALPMGMLTATLLVFGRFSADQELTAARAGGVSLVALVTPVLLLSVLLSLVCAMINLQIAPQCRRAYKNLVYTLSQQRPGTILTEGRFVKDLPGYIIYVGRISGDRLSDVLISKLDAEGNVQANLRAPRGRLQKSPDGGQVLLQLFQARGATLEQGRWQPLPYFAEWSQILTLPELGAREPKLTEMTFGQLRQELRRLERAIRAPRPGPSGLPAPRPGAVNPRQKSPVDLTSPIKVQIHQQAAFSFACLGFTLIGIPLGVRAHRRETSIGVALALVLVLIYYSFFTLAAALDTHGEWAPHLMVWLPNFLFQAIGAVLLWRANRR